jgi:hypothetical protein
MFAACVAVVRSTCVVNAAVAVADFGRAGFVLENSAEVGDPARVNMDEREWLTERFHQHRPHLRAVAYRMLGSVTEADDPAARQPRAAAGAGIPGARPDLGQLDIHLGPDPSE